VRGLAAVRLEAERPVGRARSFIVGEDPDCGVPVLAIAALAAFVPRFTHRADSLELVQDLILAGLGVGLLPADEPLRAGVQRLDLRDPEAELRSYALTRRGREAWPPLALVTRSIEGQRPSGPAGPAISG
jgi:DNA-binding transcriptional LysR family regulator